MNTVNAAEKNVSYPDIKCLSFMIKAFDKQIFSEIGYNGIALADQV
jgi:hypothetical protein